MLVRIVFERAQKWLLNVEFTTKVLFPFEMERFNRLKLWKMKYKSLSLVNIKEMCKIHSVN